MKHLSVLTMAFFMFVSFATGQPYTTGKTDKFGNTPTILKGV